MRISPSPGARYRVGVVAPSDASPSALGVTLDLLQLANELAEDGPPFEVRVLNARGGTIARRNGLSVPTEPLGGAPDAVIVAAVGSTDGRSMAERLAQRELLDTARWLSRLPSRSLHG